MGSVIVADGRAQRDRSIEALRPGFFDVDEMTLPALLSLALRYAGLVSFVDRTQGRKGDWRSYFAADETMIIAGMLTFDLQAQARRFDAWLERWEADIEADAAHPTLDLVQVLEGWQTRLQRSASPLAEVLRGLIDSVVERVRPMLDRAQGAESGIEQGSHASLKSIAANFGASVAKGRKGSDRDTERRYQRTGFYSLLKGVEMVQRQAATRLADSLRTQRHDPAVALLVAFCQLFLRLQLKLNRFTHHHLDFYHRRVLRLRPHALVPDSAYIVLTAAPGAGAIDIPAGTEFFAGRDAAQRDIIYSSDEAMVLGDARVADVRTLYFRRDPTVSPENALFEPSSFEGFERLSYPVGATADLIPADAAAPPVLGHALPPHALFGAPKRITSNSNRAPARLGFAIASPILLLNEGRRSIDVQLKFGEGDRSFEAHLAEIAAAIYPGANASTSATALQEADSFFKIFRDVFDVDISTAAGWSRIAEYLPSYSGVDPNRPRNTLALRLNLPPEFPPVVPYSAATHGEVHANTAVPVLRFSLRSDVYFYPYGLLKSLMIDEVKIDVAVEGVRKLVLHNGLGELSPLSSFAPFGPLPALGSYLVVGSEEAAAKTLTDFRLQIEWAGLPIDAGGFGNYYRGYENPPATADFRVAVTTLVDGRWLPEPEEAPTQAMFDVESQDSRRAAVASTRTLSARRVLHAFKPLGELPPDVGFGYGHDVRNGLFRFTLVSPDFVFGHRAYAGALAHALAFNARHKNEASHRPLPNPPYTPTIAGISADYRATTSFSVLRSQSGVSAARVEKLIHLHPFGNLSLPSFSYQNVPLLPAYTASGNLYIGIRANEPMPRLSLFFHMHQDSGPLSGRVQRSLRWQYLSGNQWKPLQAQQIIGDTTEAFLVSGIVTLAMPLDISTDNTVMPGGLYWLSLSAEGTQLELSAFCSVHALYTNALKATWSRRPDESLCEALLIPPGTITRARRNIPGLVGVTQVQSSFGGRAEESDAQLRVRAAERLRHKNRALQPADYEQLILERFPAVHKVKCFPNFCAQIDLDERMRPGHVLIVPVAHGAAEIAPHEMPLLSGHLLSHIRKFVAGLAPPGVRVDVRNPSFERIQVRCRVDLVDPYHTGQDLRALNAALSAFISPWCPGGNEKHFGWRLDRQDIEAYLLALPYVRGISAFSMLHIAAGNVDEDNYLLADSAAESASQGVLVQPRYPWSAPVPVAEHFLRLTRGGSRDDAAERAGLDDLAVGSTFILGD